MCLAPQFLFVFSRFHPDCKTILFPDFLNICSIFFQFSRPEHDCHTKYLVLDKETFKHFEKLKIH